MDFAGVGIARKIAPVALDPLDTSNAAIYLCTPPFHGFERVAALDDGRCATFYYQSPDMSWRAFDMYIGGLDDAWKTAGYIVT